MNGKFFATTIFLILGIMMITSHSNYFAFAADSESSDGGGDDKKDSGSKDDGGGDNDNLSRRVAACIMIHCSHTALNIRNTILYMKCYQYYFNYPNNIR
jgi:hypothetical protein